MLVYLAYMKAAVPVCLAYIKANVPVCLAYMKAAVPVSGFKVTFEFVWRLGRVWRCEVTGFIQP